MLVVWLTPQTCGTHFRLPHHLANMHWTGRAPLNFEHSGHPFSLISTQYNYTHLMDGSPLSKADFILVVWFSTKPCGTHFRLPHHFSYIHWTGRAPLIFEPSGPPFPPISSKNNYTQSMGGSPLSMSDFISVICSTPQPCGTHFRLPHNLAYIAELKELL